jgi:hypothetical protein
MYFHCAWYVFAIFKLSAERVLTFNKSTNNGFCISDKNFMEIGELG